MIYTKIKKGILDPRRAKKILQIRSKLFIGHNNYLKFFILTRSRTGSNLLLSMLNSNPQIYTAGEIFRYLEGRSLQQILEGIYAQYPKSIHAVGFKIFYYHPQDDESGQVWKLLEKINDVHIIHLKRRNILRTILSRRIAGSTGAYKDEGKKNLPSNDKVCRFTEEELLEGFQQTRRWEDRFSEQFSHKIFIELYYEDLVNNPKQEIQTISKFLHVKYSEPKTILNKQNPEKMYDIVENYHSLKTHFAQSEWSGFFDD